MHGNRISTRKNGQVTKNASTTGVVNKQPPHYSKEGWETHRETQILSVVKNVESFRARVEESQRTNAGGQENGEESPDGNQKKRERGQKSIYSKRVDEMRLLGGPAKTVAKEPTEGGNDKIVHGSKFAQLETRKKERGDQKRQCFNLFGDTLKRAPPSPLEQTKESTRATAARYRG